MAESTSSILKNTPDVATTGSNPNAQLLSLSKDPFRNKDQSSYSWLERSLDPESPTTKFNESILTTSVNTRSDGTGAELLFPTIRQDPESGELVKFENIQAAYEKAMAEDDYLSFINKEEATTFSKSLSDRIGQVRASHQEQQDYKARQPSPTPGKSLF